MAMRDKLLTLTSTPPRRAGGAVIFSDNRVFKRISKQPLWIRTAAGPAIGFGHVRRSITLGRLLSDVFLPVFLADPWDEWTRAQASAQNWRSVPFDCESLWKLEPAPAALIIDTRETRGLIQMLAESRRRGIPVISIHDLGLNPLPSDLVVDGSALPVAYDVPSPQTEFRYGTSYMVLDPSFAAFHNRKKHLRKRVSRVVVNLGGGDSKEYYPRVLRGLRSWNRSLEVTGIPGFTDWGQSHLRRLDWSPLRFRWAPRGEPVHSLLFDADIAITAGGLSAFEAICVGTPLIAVAFDELQQVTLTALAAANACFDLGLVASLEPEKLAESLTALETDFSLRRRLSESGRQVVDGRGAERVAALIRRLVHDRSDQMVGMALR